MNPRQQIAAILKEWLEKTHAEGQAIQTGDLAGLRKIQKSKAELRDPLAAAMTQWRTESPAEANAYPFRAEVNELLALETRHGQLLTARKRDVQEQKARLEQALFNLRRVRSSYAQSPDLLFNRYS
jgi:hypothetical protein